MSRWRCGNPECEKLTFSEQLIDIAAPLARRTCRVTELMRMIGHSTGGRPGERLMERLGLPTSDDTILRHLKCLATARQAPTAIRVARIDDWSWRKGCRYGTIVVDLERREVADVLEDRSAAGTADWLGSHPEVEIVSRDRCGLYAQGARQGATQARQVADRFLLIQNLREAIETQISRTDRSSGRPMLSPASSADRADDPIIGSPNTDGPYGQTEVDEHRHRVMEAYRQSRRELFERIKTLQAGGDTAHAIAQKTGFNWRTINKWLSLLALPDRVAMTPTSRSPTYYQDYLSRRWAQGCKTGRLLFNEIRDRGYTGSRSSFYRLIGRWRPTRHMTTASVLPKAEVTRAVDPATGWLISPIVAASLCIKPRATFAAGQAAKVDALKVASPEFAVMRALAMRFRGLLRGSDIGKLDVWLDDAQASGIYAIERFVRTLRQDLTAVRNAITEIWSNGQVEGQINRLKTLKRAMYGRANVEMLRARMLPLNS